MKNTAIIFAAIFCISNVILAQDTPELKYFKSDDAFYLGNSRLSDSEIKMTLSSNTQALDA